MNVVYVVNSETLPIVGDESIMSRKCVGEKKTERIADCMCCQSVSFF